MPDKVHAAVHVVDSTSDGLAGGLKTARVISGTEAFRRYGWIRNSVGVNSAGNFRGMVVSSRWATIYHITEDALKPVEKLAIFASLAANTIQASDEIERIVRSNDDWTVKGARLSTQVSSVCIRTVAGVVPAAAKVIAMSAGGYLQWADLAGLHQASMWNKTLQSRVEQGVTLFDKVTDGENMYGFINTYIVPR